MNRESLINGLLSSVTNAMASNKGPNAVVEVEVRLGKFQVKQSNPDLPPIAIFKTDIPAASWLRFQDRLDSLGLQKSEQRYAETRIGKSGYRIRKSGKQLITQLKVPGISVDDLNHNLRFAVSVEIRVLSIPQTILNTERTTRRVVRTSYIIPNHHCRIDLTASSSGGVTVHQAEVEFISKRLEDIPSFVDGALYARMLYLGSDTDYTTEMLHQICARVNLYLSVEGMPMSRVDQVDLRRLCELKSLRRKHLRESVLTDKITYCATHKVDGTHCIMVICELGVWLISPPYTYNLVLRDVESFVSEGETTILDGELTEDNKFIVSDCMAVQGCDVRSLSMDERILSGHAFIADLMERESVDTSWSFSYSSPELFTSESETLANRLPVRIGWKTVRTFCTPNEFHAACSFLLAMQEGEMPYKHDGLVFTPVNYQYRVRNDDRAAAIYKWKDPSNVTIDLRIVIEDGKVSKLLADNRSASLTESAHNPERRQDAQIEKEVEFTGSVTAPFSVDQLIVSPGLLDLSGVIAEFGWDYKESKLAFHKVRTNKASPNSLAVVQDNWSLVHHPLNASAIKGAGIEIMFTYHNELKRQLLKRLPEAAKVLLDIGSGKGGDVQKWQRFETVICIEPSLSNIEHLRTRAHNEGFAVYDVTTAIPAMPAGKKVCIANLMGQDYVRINAIVRSLTESTRGVYAVSLMDSGTFFWENQSTLDGLVSTIRENLLPGGSLVLKMMDGDAVRRRIGELSGCSRRTYNKVLSYGSGFTVAPEYDPLGEGLTGRVTVDIADSIVTDQVEYLTRLSDLVQLLGDDFSCVYQERADKSDVFLTRDAWEASSLYIVAEIKRSGEVAKPVQSSLASRLGGRRRR